MGFQDRRWCHWDHCHTGPKSAQCGDRWSLFSSSYFSEVFIIKDSKETSVCTLPADGKPSCFPGSGGRGTPPVQPPLPRSWASLWQLQCSLPSLLSQKTRRPFSSSKHFLPSVHLPAPPPPPPGSPWGLALSITSSLFWACFCFSFSSSSQLQMFSSCPHPKSQMEASFGLVFLGAYFYFPLLFTFLKGSLDSWSLTHLSCPLWNVHPGNTWHAPLWMQLYHKKNT